MNTHDLLLILLRVEVELTCPFSQRLRVFGHSSGLERNAIPRYVCQNPPVSFSLYDCRMSCCLGVLAVGMPVAVGMVFRLVGYFTSRPMLGAEVLAGYLMFATTTGAFVKYVAPAISLCLNVGGVALRNIDGPLFGQCGWSLGQCQEVHRTREPRRQGQ